MTDKHDPSSTQVSTDPDIEEHMSIGRYIVTRIPTLVPPMRPAPNPFKALTLLNRQQWLFFAVCIFISLIISMYTLSTISSLSMSTWL